MCSHVEDGLSIAFPASSLNFQDLPCNCGLGHACVKTREHKVEIIGHADRSL